MQLSEFLSSRGKKSPSLLWQGLVTKLEVTARCRSSKLAVMAIHHDKIQWKKWNILNHKSSSSDLDLIEGGGHCYWSCCGLHVFPYSTSYSLQSLEGSGRPKWVLMQTFVVRRSQLLNCQYATLATGFGLDRSNASLYPCIFRKCVSMMIFNEIRPSTLFWKDSHQWLLAAHAYVTW